MGVFGFLIAKCNVLEGGVLVERISRKAEELARQCALAAEGIAAERVWPGSPDAATLKGCAEDIAAQRSVVVALEEQLHDARQALKAIVGKARKEMARVDCASDVLYGIDGAQKAKFGLTPKKTTTTPSARGCNPLSRAGDWGWYGAGFDVGGLGGVARGGL